LGADFHYVVKSTGKIFILLSQKYHFSTGPRYPFWVDELPEARGIILITNGSLRLSAENKIQHLII
jgi:hypothetical protein